MRVLGIDPGYAIVGWGVVDYVGNRFAPVGYGAVLTDKDTPFEQRLAEIYEGVQDILRRYYALGGREVSFASDAHLTWRVAEKREKVVKALRQIGFAFLTVPKAGAHLRVEI